MSKVKNEYEVQDNLNKEQQEEETNVSDLLGNALDGLEIDWDEVIAPEASQGGFGGGESGVCTIVHSRNGRRLMFSQQFIDEVIEGSVPNKIKIALAQKCIVVGTNITKGTEYNLKKQGSKYIVYCGPLTKQMKEYYNIDFAGGVAKTFKDAAYKDDKDDKYALIPMDRSNIINAN